MNEKKGLVSIFFYVLLFHISEDYKMRRKESFFITYDEILRCVVFALLKRILRKIYYNIMRMNKMIPGIFVNCPFCVWSFLEFKLL